MEENEKIFIQDLFKIMDDWSNPKRAKTLSEKAFLEGTTIAFRMFKKHLLNLKIKI